MESLSWTQFKQTIDDLYDLDSEPRRLKTVYLEYILSRETDKPEIESVKELYEADLQDYVAPIIQHGKKILSLNPTLYCSLLQDVSRFCVYRSFWLNKFSKDWIVEIPRCIRTWKNAEINVIHKTVSYQRDLQTHLKNIDLYPNLEYVLDEGSPIILPVSDVFWNLHYPPNSFNAVDRIGISDDPVTITVPEIPVNQALRHNSGVSGRFFIEYHPYYNLPESEKPYWDKLSIELFDTVLTKLKVLELTPYTVQMTKPKAESVKRSIWSKIFG